MPERSFLGSTGEAYARILNAPSNYQLYRGHRVRRDVSGCPGSSSFGDRRKFPAATFTGIRRASVVPSVTALRSEYELPKKNTVCSQIHDQVVESTLP